MMKDSLTGWPRVPLPNDLQLNHHPVLCLKLSRPVKDTFTVVERRGLREPRTTCSTSTTIEFFDAKGKAVESSSGGSGSFGFGFGGDITYSRSWQIASDAKSIKAKISYYTKTETLKVPCKPEFGLGL
jgi:hypothetical protein